MTLLFSVTQWFLTWTILPLRGHLVVKTRVRAKILLPNPLQGTEQPAPKTNNLLVQNRETLPSNSPGPTGDLTFHKPIWEAYFSRQQLRRRDHTIIPQKTFELAKKFVQVSHKSWTNFLAIPILLQSGRWFSHNSTNKRIAKRTVSQ